jgi:toxin YoeB
MGVYFADNVLSEMFDLYHNKKLQKKIERMLKELERNPHSAFAKAELLKGNRAGQRSMRIDEKHRLIFSIEDGIVKIIQCGEHYEN